MPKLITAEKFTVVLERLKSGSLAFQVVAEELGVAVETVAQIAEGTHVYQTMVAVQSRSGETAGKRFRAVGEHREVYLPTPEQIEAECARLRASRPPIKDDDCYDDED